jgi:hypothetical protein
MVLRERAGWLERRGARSPLTSHERRKCDANAQHLRACAELVTSKTEAGATVRERLAEADAFGHGWRHLAEWVTLLAGKFRADAEKAAVMSDISRKV